MKTSQSDKPIKLYPEDVVVVIEFAGMRFKSDPLYGGDVANKLFSKTPHMKGQIRELKQGVVLDPVYKMLGINIIVTRPSAEVNESPKARGRSVPASRARPVEYVDRNPVTGRPFANEDERKQLQEDYLSGKIKVDLPPDDGEADPLEVVHLEIRDGEAIKLDTKCRVCLKPLYKTTQGKTCANGHGLKS